MELKLAFIGFGNVARAFARMIAERRAQLADQYGLSWRAVAIATANHGSVISGSGLDLIEAAERVEKGGSLTRLQGVSFLKGATSLIEECGANVLFETTPLNPVDGSPATDYIRRALACGINVVTANKGPVAFAHRELREMAARRGVSLRFEGTVMDGAPVFNLAEYCLPAAKIMGFAGALNSTTNFILSGMEEGRSFDEGLAEMRRLGIVEANADYDIDGWDAAVKAVVIANVLMNVDVRPADVAPVGIRGITREQLKAARASGKAIRLISRASYVGGDLKLTVAPEEVRLGSELGAARGTTNVLVLSTDLMGELAIFESDPKVEQTAYALLSDMIRVHSSMIRGVAE